MKTIFLIIYLFSKSIMAQNIENKGVNDCRIDI